ncbi:haloacid dehalogenase type II [Amycolatopsis sp. WAC 01375]|uniref:haloacid dehalogenase type II n=1 Tax=unclassified Amycolatopsis TaxID=2618356 RepID=UPI000F7A55C2|nr:MULTISPECIES: haloacid dehalogenase type II [unclassified Amycolatopsis]RSM79846.1 haloacid dehalogenase type II [Amycolatopsis sp. WAC 01375]RSN27314.1 haloacid dehalogenase type II [Amycolatopsis sp. WAC 01416]
MEIDALVFDILGTLVDEPAGIRAAIRQAVPDADADELVELWQGHVETEQRRIVEGERPYAPSDVLDREAAQLVTKTDVVPKLSPWPDSVEGLARLAESHRMIGLSNAGRTSLLRINAHAGLRWHVALSAEDAQTYKPDPAVYELAVEASGAPPERLLMVATHAWDLRGAQSVGLRTAYVARPVGDPPSVADRFDFHADDLADLAGQLAKHRT